MQNFRRHVATARRGIRALAVDRRNEPHPHRSATLGRLTQYVVGAATLVIGAIGLLSAPSEEYSGVGVWIVVAIAASSIPVSLVWFVGEWPRRSVIVGFVAYADITIAVSLWLKVEHLMAIGGTVLFAVVAVLAAVASSIRVSAVHMVFSVLFLGALAVRAAGSDAGSGWVIAAHSLTMLLMFCTPVIVVTHVMELSSRADSALLDPLTGLSNRRGLFDRMRLLDEQPWDPVNLDSVAVVSMDIDDFKHINDRRGHLAGDEALVEFAGHVSALAPSARAIARMGGDEFVCIFAGSAASVATDVRRFVDDLTVVLRTSPISVSVGRSSTAIDRHTDVHAAIGRILAEADVDLYRAKSRKKAGAVA